MTSAHARQPHSLKLSNIIKVLFSFHTQRLSIMLNSRSLRTWVQLDVSNWYLATYSRFVKQLN